MSAVEHVAASIELQARSTGWMRARYDDAGRWVEYTITLPDGWWWGWVREDTVPYCWLLESESCSSLWVRAGGEICSTATDSPHDVREAAMVRYAAECRGAQ